jgi:hypothetical protein
VGDRHLRNHSGWPLKFTVEPATAEDIEAFGPPFGYRVQAIACKIDDRTIGVGGIGFLDNGDVALWARLTDEIRKHPVQLHKTALAFIDEHVRKRGIPLLSATADPSIPAAPRWLERLGFKPVGNRMYVWRP